MVPDALAPYVARSSAAVVLNVYDWHVLYFHEGYLDYFSVEESYEMGIDIQLIGP